MLEHPEDALPENFVDAWLTRSEASAYLASIGVRRTRGTLATLYATSDDGPLCIHRGRIPLYSKRTLHLWGVGQLNKVRRLRRVSDVWATKHADPSPHPTCAAEPGMRCDCLWNARS